MKFICPSCKKEASIIHVMSGCIVAETVQYDDDGAIDCGVPEFNYINEEVYQCGECDVEIPVDKDPCIDDVMLEYLKKQPYNQNIGA